MGCVMVLLVLLRTGTFVSLAFSIEAGWRAILGRSWWTVLIWVAITTFLASLARVAGRRATRIEEAFVFGGLASVTDDCPRLTAAVKSIHPDSDLLETLPLRPYTPSKPRMLGQFAISVLEVILAAGGIIAVFVGAFFVPAGNWTFLLLGVAATLFGLPLMAYKRRSFTRVNLSGLAGAVLPPGHPLVPEPLLRSFWATAQIAAGKIGSIEYRVDRTEKVFQHLVLAWVADKETSAC